jgi:hypothetical protein
MVITKRIAIVLIAIALSVLAANAQSGNLTITISNESTTGTTTNALVKLTGAGTGIITTATDTSGVIGICVSSCGTSGLASIAEVGLASCIFDGATTANDYVINSTTVAGDCEDGGSSATNLQQIIGRVLSTNATGGTYAILLGSSGVNAAPLPSIATPVNPTSPTIAAPVGDFGLMNLVYMGRYYLDNYPNGCTRTVTTSVPAIVNYSSTGDTGVGTTYAARTAPFTVATSDAISCLVLDANIAALAGNGVAIYLSPDEYDVKAAQTISLSAGGSVNQGLVLNQFGGTAISLYGTSPEQTHIEYQGTTNIQNLISWSGNDNRLVAQNFRLDCSNFCVGGGGTSSGDVFYVSGSFDQIFNLHGSGGTFLNNASAADSVFWLDGEDITAAHMVAFVPSITGVLNSQHGSHAGFAAIMSGGSISSVDTAAGLSGVTISGTGTGWTSTPTVTWTNCLSDPTLNFTVSGGTITGITVNFPGFCDTGAHTATLTISESGASGLTFTPTWIASTNYNPSTTQLRFYGTNTTADYSQPCTTTQPAGTLTWAGSGTTYPDTPTGINLTNAGSGCSQVYINIKDSPSSNYGFKITATDTRTYDLRTSGAETIGIYVPNGAFLVGPHPYQDDICIEETSSGEIVQAEYDSCRHFALQVSGASVQSSQGNELWDHSDYYSGASGFYIASSASNNSAFEFNTCGNNPQQGGFVPYIDVTNGPANASTNLYNSLWSYMPDCTTTHAVTNFPSTVETHASPAGTQTVNPNNQYFRAKTVYEPTGVSSPTNLNNYGAQPIDMGVSWVSASGSTSGTCNIRNQLTTTTPGTGAPTVTLNLGESNAGACIPVISLPPVTVSTATSVPLIVNNSASLPTADLQDWQAASTRVSSVGSNGVATFPAIISGGTLFSATGCSASSTVGGASAGQFVSGVTGTCTLTITMGGSIVAPHGWSCRANDLTTNANSSTWSQTASTTSTATIAGNTTSGDVISFDCMAY